MPTILPTLTLNRRRFYVVRAGHPVADVIELEPQQHRHALTCHYLIGPWRLLVTGSRSPRRAAAIAAARCDFTGTPRRAR